MDHSSSATSFSATAANDGSQHGLSSHHGDPPVSLGDMPSQSRGVSLLHEKSVIREAGRAAINQFLVEHTCFSIIRISGKVVVFDTRIPIQLAFYALVEHGEFTVM